MSNILTGILNEATPERKYSTSKPVALKESQNGISASDLADILYNRLEMRYPDIVTRYGHEVVGDIVMDVADFHAGAEELGTSDVSIMIRQILKKLENYNVDESKEVDYGDDYQNMVKRVGQLAKEGPRKTVYDPVKRVYKTVPVNPPQNKGVAEGKDDKIAQLKKDHDTAVHWSKNDTNPHKREAARQKAEKIKAHLEKQYKQGVAEDSDSYTVANDPDKPGMYSYKEIGHALQSGHSDNAKIYKNNKFLATVGNAKKQSVAEARTDKNLTEPTSYIQVKQLIDKMDKGGKKRIAKALRKNLGITTQDQLDEKWSQKYKSSINCSHPKGFSQKAHCAGKKKHNESIEMEMVCEDCGMCETHADHQNLDEACWKGYHKEGNKKMFGKTYPNCVKNESEENIAEEKCPHCSGPMFSELMINEKKDACYYKVKSRYKVWPSAYASGALVKCRNKGAANWGNSTKNEDSMDQVDESLHDWFNKEKWVRMDTKGNIKGPCAKEPGEGKPKCLPQSKAHSLGKKGRASAAQRKRREDPNPDRSGKAINVNTKKKSNEGVAEEFELAGVGVAYELGRKAYKQGMTIRDNPYSATKEARKYDEWEKGLERGKWDAIEARKFRNKFNESELKDKKDLDAKRKLDLEKEARSKGIKESAILKGLLG